MTSRLYIDIESRSVCDLRKCGVYVYAEHPSTQITHVSWAPNNAPIDHWHLQQPDRSALTRLQRDIDAADILVAHNAGFERRMLCGQPGFGLGIRMPVAEDLSRWDCTAARAAAVGLPRTLEGAANALGMSIEKDKEGHALMLRMCKPRKPRKGEPQDAVLWWETPEQMEREAVYCDKDVEVERGIDLILPPLMPIERRAWEVTERMNDRGIAVDTSLLGRMILLIHDAQRDLNARISFATGGAVPKASDHMALTRWLKSQGIDDADETGVGKAAVAAMLENPDIPDIIREVLLMRRDGGGSSSRKYHAILRRLSRDGRLRGAMVYCGAAATGRWSSRGAQLQNLPRGGTVKRLLQALDDILAGMPLALIHDIYGPPLIVASELLRPVFVARG